MQAGRIRNGEMDNLKRAHQILSSFHSICDDYNSEMLDGITRTELKCCQDLALEAFNMFKIIHEKNPCEATTAYLMFCGKVLLRLSYLVHSGRRETVREANDYFADFIERNKLYQTHIRAAVH